MDQSFRSVEPLKCALFVDFDNIYIGLSKTDPAAAERFAADPARWLAWLEKGLPLRGASAAPARERSILIRRCYPNPDAGFRRYRSFFTSAAFSVIDCPTLTRTGKNSSDIYMVMDILDTLSHKTTFDEFIIFSGDSDFMPVLLRLRAHDRRTTTLAIDFMPPAFKAACDLVINEEEFIEDALGISHEGSCGGNGTGRARVPMTVLKEMAGRVYTAVCDKGEVAGADLPDILKDYREFRESNNWLGFGTSLRLAEALACSEPRLQLVRINPMLYKLVVKPQVLKPEPVPAEPAQPVAARVMKIRPVARAEKSAPLVEKAPQAAAPNAASSTAARNGEKLSRADSARLRSRVIAIVKELVSGSPNAILLARASQHVVTQLGSLVLDTQWAGAGSFKRLLQGAGDLGLEITTQPEPGYIFDPQRHMHPAQRSQTATADPEEGEAAALDQEAQARPALGESSGIEDAPSIPTGFGGPIEEADASVDTSIDEEVEEGTLHPETEPYLLEHLPGEYEDGDEEDEDEEEDEEYEESLPSLEEFARRVSQVTGAPDLTERQYALVFHGIVNELQGIAEGEKVYNTYQSSKAVSDWCAEHGESISRSDVVQIFKGIIFQDGVRFGKRPGSYTVHELATVVRNNIKALCRRSRMELSEYEEHLLDEWILGELEDEDIMSSSRSNGGSNGSADANEATIDG